MITIDSPGLAILIVRLIFRESNRITRSKKFGEQLIGFSRINDPVLL
jgi:hypothetical protein